MSVFYDPKLRQTKLWVKISFIAVPIILIVLGFIFGKQYADHKKGQQGVGATKDIFE